MKTEILTDDVMNSLLSRGWSEEEIAKLSPEEAFDEYCEWHGLRGWGQTLRRALSNIQSANTTIKKGKTTMKSEKLKQWLRENSSGVYRPSAEAADYIQELEECLAEAVDLMEDVRVGAYKPDSCTTQPWKRILSDNTPVTQPAQH